MWFSIQYMESFPFSQAKLLLTFSTVVVDELSVDLYLPTATFPTFVWRGFINRQIPIFNNKLHELPRRTKRKSIKSRAKH